MLHSTFLYYLLVSLGDLEHAMIAYIIYCTTYVVLTGILLEKMADLGAFITPPTAIKSHWHPAINLQGPNGLKEGATFFKTNYSCVLPYHFSWLSISWDEWRDMTIFEKVKIISWYYRCSI